MSIQNSKPEILTLKDWLITFLIMAIPIVNIIMLLLWAFENKVNENKSNWAKATLIWIGIFMIFGLIIGLIAGEMLGSLLS